MFPAASLCSFHADAGLHSGLERYAIAAMVLSVCPNPGQ